MNASFSFVAKLWLYSGKGAWHFVTMPKQTALDIKTLTNNDLLPRRGFGSVKVRVTCRGVSWDTSLFPDSKSDSFLLPISKMIGMKTDLKVDDEAQFKIIVLSI